VSHREPCWQRNLVLVGGLTGSGKTMIATDLARRIGAAYIDKDTVTKVLVDRLLVSLGSFSGDRDSEAYRNIARAAEYECFVDTMVENALIGTPTIGCAPFLSEFNDPDWREALEARLNGSGVRVTYFWIACDLDVTKDRMLERWAPRDRIKMEIWEEYREFARSIEVPGAPVITLDNSAEGRADEVVSQVIRLLG
jgi:predicted kinase